MKCVFQRGRWQTPFSQYRITSLSAFLLFVKGIPRSYIFFGNTQKVIRDVPYSNWRTVVGKWLRTNIIMLHNQLPLHLFPLKPQSRTAKISGLNSGFGFRSLHYLWALWHVYIYLKPHVTYSGAWPTFVGELFNFRQWAMHPEALTKPVTISWTSQNQLNNSKSPWQGL